MQRGWQGSVCTNVKQHNFGAHFLGVWLVTALVRFFWSAVCFSSLQPLSDWQFGYTLCLAMVAEVSPAGPIKKESNKREKISISCRSFSRQCEPSSGQQFLVSRTSFEWTEITRVKIFPLCLGWMSVSVPLLTGCVGENFLVFRGSRYNLNCDGRIVVE